MDNLSEKDTKEPTQSSSEKDLKFEEIVNVDDIQKVLKQKIENEDADIEFIPEIKELNTPQKKRLLTKTEDKPDEAVTRTEIDYNSKKYVVYIDSDNIEFMDHLAANERREIINKILREQNEIGKKNKIIKDRQKFFTHALVVTFTFIIGFPIMFFCVNKAIEGSMDNYQQAQKNFVKLYRKQGKIKQNDIPSDLSE